jgi:hypothetical protein
VPTSHCSSALAGVSITWAPVDHLAMVFDMSSEMNAPVKPTTAENTTSMPTLSPPSARNRFTPSTLSVTESTSITARLVTRKRTMRFMSACPVGKAV